jgi:dTDP-4-amino-4,6-dideoxygalactose transaminase
MKTDQIPQCNPLASYQRIKAEIDDAISKVLSRGIYILGREVGDFESEFADYQGGGRSVGVANGTDALELSLRALGISAGSPVYTLSHTAVATVAAIEKAGASPVLVDIDPKSYTMCPHSFEAAVVDGDGTPPKKTGGAVILVHLYGQPAPHLPEILQIANKHGLHVVEDCSQAHGAEWTGNKVGTFGDIAAFSLYPTKNLGALGDGGICFTKNPDLAEKIRGLREYGWKQRYVSDFPGGNSRLDELQAAILRIKLRHLDRENEARRKIAAGYRAGLQNHAIHLPQEHPDGRHVYHQFVIRVEERNMLKDYLADRQIGTLIHYPVPIHLQPAYKGRISISPSGMQETERAALGILSLPMYPEMEEASVDRVIVALNDWQP